MKQIDGPFLFSTDQDRGAHTANSVVAHIREAATSVFRARLAAGDIENSRAATRLGEELDRLLSEVALLRKELVNDGE